MPRTLPLCLRTLLSLLVLLVPLSALAQTPVVSGYVLVSQRAVTRTVYEYSYRGLLTNGARELLGATASVSSSSSATVIVEGDLSFGPAAAGAVVMSLDTFTFRHDRSVPYRPEVLQWSVAPAFANRAPVAVIRPPATVIVGEALTLDGSGSHDPDSTPITYSWQITQKPPTSLAAMAATTPVAALTPDVPGRYVVRLVVSDGSMVGETSVTLETANRPPTARIAPLEAPALVAGAVALDGTGSSDPDGDALVYSWQVTGRPTGSAALIAGTGSAVAITPDRPGVYEVTLTVNDGTLTDTDVATVTTQNSPPVANAGPDQTAPVGATASLTGAGSTDVDGDLLTYAWSIVSNPAGSTSSLNDPSSLTPTLLLDAAGTYRIRLVATDVHGAHSTPDEVLVSTTNSSPVSNAGPDQTVERGQVVTLDGSGSTDVDGDPLTYSWTIRSTPTGSAAVLANASTVAPTFIADRKGEFVLRLVVSDGTAASSDEVTITTSNTAPIGDAGPDASATVGATVTLDGSGSTDVDGDALSYSWSLVSEPTGARTTLSDATVARPTFVLNEPGTYVFQLLVNDATVSSAPDTVTITTANSAPTADAGLDQSFVAGSTVSLDGTKSTDPDGDPLTYSWSLVLAPNGSAAALSATNAPSPSFVADREGTFVAQLVVNDGLVSSAPDTVTVTSTNVRPVANAGPDQADRLVGAAVALDGSGSVDADGHTLSYAWAIIARPLGSVTTLVGETSGSPTFSPDVPGEYVVQLIVSDGFAFSQPDTAIIVVTLPHDNAKPVARAGDDQSADAPGTVVQLDGSASTDADGDALSYRWRFVSVPAGSAASLPDPGLALPTFIVDVPGLYVIELVVNDGTADSDPDQLSVNGNAPPVAEAGTTQVVVEGAVVQLDGGASFDPDPSYPRSCPATGEYPNELRWQWIFNRRPAGSSAVLSSTTIPNPTFVADVAGEYIVQLVVNDCIVNSESDVVKVRTYNGVPTANAGPDQFDVEPGTTVSLDGRLSADPDGDALSYLWQFERRPATSDAVIFNPTSQTPTFVVDRPGRYEAKLVVSDGFATSTADFVVVRTPNRAPTANAGADKIGTVGVSVAVSGNGSDPDSDPLTYAWTLVGRPEGSAAALVTPASSTTSFVPDLGGVYTLRFVVSDGLVSSEPDEVIVSVTSGNVVLSLLNPGLMGVGRTNTARVLLTAPAPAGGVTVTATSDEPGVVGVVPPGTAFIAAGATQAQLTLSGVSPGSTLIRASAPLYVDGTLSVTVTDKFIALPSSVSATIGITAAIPVTISPEAAPAGGLAVAVTSADASKLEVVTPVVTIPAGAFSANATVRGVGGGTVAVSATHPDFVTGSGNVTVTGSLNILEAAVSMTPGFPQRIRVQLESSGSPIIVPAAGLTVSLSAANPTCVSVPSTVVIPSGQTFVSQVLAYGSTATLPCTTALTASAPGLTPDTVNVTVNPNPGMTLYSPMAAAAQTGSVFPRYVGSGLQDGPYWVRLGASNHGGVTIRVSSSSSSALLVAPNATTPGTAFVDLPVADGASDVSFYIQGVEGQTGSVNVSTSAPGFNGTTSGAINVVTPAVSLLGSLTATTTALSSDSVFRVQTGVPSADGTTLRSQNHTGLLQAVRAGGASLGVTVTSGTPSVGLIRVLSGAAATVSVAIPVGQNQTGSSVALGGIAFDPVAGGTTSVTASAPGFVTVTNATQVVTVTAPGITVYSPMGAPNQTAPIFPRYVGAGLQDGPYWVRLGAPNHGGVTVRVTSSSPSALLVAANATTPGAPFVDLPVADGATDVSFYVQGVEGQTGTGTIDASAPGFTATTSGAINVVTPAVSLLNSLTGTTTALSTDSSFRVWVGPPSSDGSTLRSQSYTGQAQAVRAGGAPLGVTVTSSTPVVGVLKAPDGTAATVTVSIPVGQAQTGATVATGGVAFDPVSGGTTTVSATIPGFVSTTAAAQSVTVSAPTITVYSAMLFANQTQPVFPRYVGAGLQDGPYWVRLGASNHGGVTVRLVSSSPAAAVIAPNATTPGAAFIDLAIADGATDASFYIQGLEGQAGTMTVTASAPGFTGTTSGAVNVVAPALSLLNSLTATTTALSADSVFRVSVGPPSADGTTLRSQNHTGLVQPVRAGGIPLSVTLTTSAPTVGLVKTLSGSSATATAVIPVGQSQTWPTVATGGLAFDPVAGGTTVVSATIPGFVATPTASQSVSVTAPGMTVFSPMTVAGQLLTVFPRYVGAGLQDGPYWVRLGASNHGGVSIRVSSASPTTLLVAPNATTPGTAFIDLPIADGATDVSFYVQGVEGQVGSVTFTAAAPGFTGATSGVINVVTPAVSLLDSPPSTTTASSPDAAFRVSVGPPAADGVTLRNQNYSGFLQAVRAGASPLVVSLSSSSPGVGLVKTQAGASASASVSIVAGQSQTAPTVVGGGVSFDPLAAGTTTISAAIPGYVTTTAASKAVVVTTPAITLYPAMAFPAAAPSTYPRYVGAGLQDGPYWVRLGGPNHGGVTVRVASSDGSRLLIAPNGTTAGAAFVDLQIANGSTDASFYVQGVDGQTGDVTLSATAPSFAGATSGVITVVTPAYRITALPTSIAAAGATTVFRVEIGVPDAFGADLLTQTYSGTSQAVRFGGLLTATVTNSNAIGSQLVTASGGAQSWAVNVLAGQSMSASTVATGGIAFDPLSGACAPVGCDTFVEANIAGLVKVNTATRTVRVTP